MFLSLVIKYYYRCVVPMTVVHGLNVWVFLTSCILFLYLMCFYKRLILVLSDTLSNIYILSISHMGGSGNNLILGEDGRDGASRLLGVSGSYWGHADTPLLYDANGHLIKGTHLVNGSEASQTAVAQLPGSPGAYGLLSRDEAGALHYYQADLSEAGYGTVEAPQGEIHAVQSFSDRYYGRHMAVLENHAANRARIYVTAHEASSNESTLYTIDIEEGQVYAPEPVLSYASHDREGDGELKISPDGRVLYIYNHGKRLGFFAHREAEVLSFQLDASGNVLRADSGYALSYGNKGKGSLETGHTSEWLYVSRTGLVNYAGSGQDRHRSVYRIPVAGSHTESVSEVASVSGDSRLRYSDSLYVTAGGEEHLLRVHEGLFGNTVQQTILSHRLTGYQSMQPHRVYDREVLELVALRSVGSKSYELTDHLGNVKAVVSDRKKLSDEVREYRYVYGFENSNDVPSEAWSGWSFSTEHVYRGSQSVKVTGFGHLFRMAVEPGDTVSAEAMMKFVSGTTGSHIYLAFQDENGQNEVGVGSEQRDLPSHQHVNEWSRIVHPPTVVPAGKYSVLVYLRKRSEHSEAWFDDFKISVKRGYTEPVLSAEVLSANSYYAFGSLMPKRSFNSSGYRYGFNGKEDDKETGYQDYGVRQYNPKLGRFFSADPLIIQGQQYLYLSPYQFAGNNPIAFVDLDGLEPAQYVPNGDGTFITVPASDRIPVPVDPNAKFQNTNRTNGYSVLDFLGDLFSLNFGFVFYSSGGTDPNAQVERNAKHRVPIDMQDVEDATLGADKSTGKSRNPIQQKDVKKAFDEQANQQRNNPQNAQYNMPRDTPDGDPFKKPEKNQGAGNKQEQGTYYKGSPQGSDFTLYEHDQKVFERKDNVVILGGEQ